MPFGSNDTTAFWDNVDKSGTCWVWTGTKVNGYGALNIEGATLGAHVCSWEMHFGPIPKGLVILHVCDNPPCVNPNHLALGTKAANNLDKLVKGRHGDAKLKLTFAIAEEIRQRARAGASYKDLQLAFNISEVMISRIIQGRSWSVRPHDDHATWNGLMRGEGNQHSRLTADQVREIRQRYAQGDVSQETLGKAFGVTRSSIGRIVNYEAWWWLDREEDRVKPPKKLRKANGSWTHLSVRVDPEIYAQVKELAGKQRVTLSELVVRQLERIVEEQEEPRAA